MVAKYKKFWPPSCDASVGPIDDATRRLWGTAQKVIFFTGQLCASHMYNLGHTGILESSGKAAMVGAI